MPLNVTWNPITYINSTNITGWFYYANEQTGFMFMNAMSFVIFLIAFMVFRKWSDKDALAASGFVSAVMSLILFAANLINGYVVILFFFITAVGMFMQQR